MSSVDPVHFGAIPGGAAATNRAAIQAALDTGKHVRFGTPGSYNINAKITQSISGQQVNGNGVELVQTIDADGWQLGVGDAVNRRVEMGLENLTIRYDGTIPSSSTGVIIVESSNCQLQNVVANATGATGWAVGLDIRSLFSGTHYNQIFGGAFIGCRVDGVRLSPDFDAPGTGSANENSFWGVRIATAVAGNAGILFRHNGANPNPSSNNCSFYSCPIEGVSAYAVRMLGGTNNSFYNMRLEGTWSTDAVSLDTPTQNNSFHSLWNSNGADDIADLGTQNKFHTPTHEHISVAGSALLAAAGISPYQWFRRGGNDNSNRSAAFRFEDNDIDNPGNAGPSQLLDLEGEFNSDAAAYFIQGSSLSGPTIQFRVTGLGQGRFGAGLTLDAAGIGSAISEGTSTPEGAVTRPIGSTFHRTDGGVTTTLYVKEVGTGNTGWEGMASRSYVDGPGVTAFSGASGTFSAAGVRVATLDADATNVTDFTSGVAGQELTIIGTGARTIEHGALIALSGSVNRVMASGSVLALVNDGSKWFEVGRP